MITFSSNMMVFARGRGRRALTAAQETGVVAVCVAVGLAGALGVVLHALVVVTSF